MNSSLIWNIRSVTTQQAFERVVLLHTQKHFNYVALLEPFQHVRHIDMYKLWLNMGTTWHNVNGKIWIFVDAEIQVEIMRDTEKLLSCRFTHLGDGQELVLTVVYASTDRSGRIALWEDLYDMSSHITIPWLVGGDFNVITDDIEKFGGLPIQFAETEDIRQCIDIFQLMDLGFTRKHLIKQGSDHSPLLVNMRADSRPIRKYFRKGVGQVTPYFRPHLERLLGIKLFLVLRRKRRNIKGFGNIDREQGEVEFPSLHHIQVHEQEFEQNPTGLNRERLQRVQRRKLQLQRIQDHTGTWLDTEEEIAQEAIRFFSDQFKEENIPTDFSMLDKIPKMVTEEQNQQLYEMPDEVEVKRAVFGLNGDSAGGPDDFTGRFFQAC
ncbi:uncharacterized protein LOC132631203 [Lycium barbarum]|uniref:uncharacterized protein LOC132631203 n=1 Tax=Lycium barbarum TaxID=112863 RepID=UPI00293F38AB|nr:uncharacterized protein LOC132631203 [Lycium barbarum]